MSSGKTTISCIFGHRYGRHLANAIITSKEYCTGKLDIPHVFCLHPSFAYSAGGYEPPFRVLTDAGISFSYFEHVNSDDVYERMKKIAPRYVFVCGLRQIVDPRLLRLTAEWENRLYSPSRGFIGFHPSDLPDGAGLSPVQWTILDKANAATVSAFFLGDADIDGGDVVDKSRFPCAIDIDADKLDELIGQHIALLASKIVILMIQHNVTAIPQSSLGTRQPARRQLRSIDRWLDFQDDAVSLERRVRAFTRPYGGAVLLLNDQVCRVYKVGVIDSPGRHRPGEILARDPYLVVQCGKGALRLEDIEWIGKRTRDASSAAP